MKYQFIQNHSLLFPVAKMASILEVHRSSYYRWCKKSNNRDRARKNEQKIIKEIMAIQKDTRFSYGTPRITKELKNRSMPVNHKKVARLLRENNLNHRAKKRFKNTTDSRHALPVAPNVLNRDFSASAPNQKWVSDITYIWTSEGWLYLCVIIDLYSKMVVGWSASSKIDTDLVLKAFWNAIELRNPPKGLIFHSDRGVQYCALRFRNALKSRGIIQSMSRKGNCWDNACAETFFKSLKSEWFHGEKFDTRKAAKHLLFEYIEIFYNKKRTHSFLGYYSPQNYELNKVA